MGQNHLCCQIKSSLENFYTAHVMAGQWGSLSKSYGSSEKVIDQWWDGDWFTYFWSDKINKNMTVDFNLLTHKHGASTLPLLCYPAEAENRDYALHSHQLKKHTWWNNWIGFHLPAMIHAFHNAINNQLCRLLRGWLFEKDLENTKRIFSTQRGKNFLFSKDEKTVRLKSVYHYTSRA